MTDSEFDLMIKKEKKFVTEFREPKINLHEKYELIDKSGVSYIFDYQLGNAGKMVLSMNIDDKTKQKLQTRYTNLPLIRVDINGSPHFDSNGNLSKSHIHIFYPSGIKVYPLANYDSKIFQDTSPTKVLQDFFSHNNIVCTAVQERI